MNDDIASLWRRHLDADPLSESETQRLHAALAEDPSLREALLADEEIHWRLASLARIEDPDDDFVAAVARHIERSPATTDDELPADREARESGTAAARIRRPVLIVSLSAAALIAGVVGVWLVDPGSGGIASVVHASGAVWSGAPPGARLIDAQTLELEQGSAELRFDHGASITLEGPVGVTVGNGAISVRHGAISVRLPDGRDRFRVETGLSRIEDRGVDFDVTVAPDGSSGWEVLAGVLRVETTDSGGESITLAPGELRRARISTPEIASGLRPTITRMTGADGTFAGRISLAGASVECREAATFEKLLDEVIARPSPASLLADWTALSARCGTGASSSVSVSVGAATFEAAGLDDAIRLDEALPAALEASDASGAFSGSIRVDGVLRRFSNRSEFEAARRALDLPLARFRLLPVGDDAASGTSMESTSTRSFSTRSSTSSGVFHGEIEVDGRLRVFSDREEYERALDELRDTGRRK